MPGDYDIARVKNVYFGVYPDAVERQAWKGITYVRASPQPNL